MQQDNIKKSVVKPGSIFHTDCWRAYIGVAPDLAAAISGFDHLHDAWWSKWSRK